MVRHHDRQFAVRYLLPQPIAILARSKWWRALSEAAEALDVLLGVEEVVRARLAADVDAARLRFGDQLDAARCAHVHDMNAAAGLAGNRDGTRDGFQLGGRRPRAYEVARTLPAGGERPAGEVVDHRRILGMQEEDRVQLRNSLHAFAKRPIVGLGEVVDATGAHEGLEPHEPPL